MCRRRKRLRHSWVDLLPVVGVLIDWTGEFDRWYDQLIQRAEAGDERSLDQLALTDAALGVLQGLRARRGRKRRRRAEFRSPIVTRSGGGHTLLFRGLRLT